MPDRSALLMGLLLAIIFLGLACVLLYRKNKLIQSQLVKMRESEFQFRNMFNDHSAVMLLVEPKSGRIREGNRAASQFYGYSVEKLKSMSMDEINTLDVNQAAVVRDRILNKEKNYFVLQHRLASGEIRDIEAYSTPIDSGGETVLFSIINDITERKEMEKELQQERDALARLLALSEEFLANSELEIDLQKITDNLLQISGAKYAAFNLFDDNGLDFQTVAVSGVSEHLVKITKILGFELTGKKWAYDKVRAERTSGKIITRFTSVMDLTGDVLPHPVMLLMKKLFNPGEVVVAKIHVGERVLGDFTIFMPGGVDFTADSLVSIYIRQVGLLLQRKRADAALYKSEEKHRFLIENSHEIIYTMTPDGVFTFVSPSWTVHLGHPVEDVVGKSFQQFVHPDDLDVCLGWMQKAIRTGQRHNDIVEYRAHHVDGSWYWHISSVVPLKNEAGDVIGFEGTARDITARKQAQDALNNSFSLIEATLESINNGILVISHDGAVIKANSRFVEMWHIPGDVIASGNDNQLLDFILTQLSDPDVFIAKIRELYSEPKTESFDIINFKDGRIFERISKPMFVEGEPRGRVWSFLDITERNRANEALQNERLLLRTLIDNIPDSIYMVDLDCRKILANKTEVRFMGAQSEAEVLGKNDFDIYPKELAESFLADNLSVIQAGIPVINREEYIFDENGQKRWLLTSKFPLRDRNNQIIGLVGIGRDITIRRRAEDALRTSESKIRAIADSARDAILMLDPDGNVSYWNPAAEVILGYTNDEAMGQNLHQLIVPQRYHAAQQAAFPGFIQTGQGAAIGKSLEVEALRKDGVEIPVQLSLSSFLLNGAWYSVGIISDITERKLAEVELQETNRQLEATVVRANFLAVQAEMASVAKSEFLANMSHEIRTPMNGVIGMTGLLLDTDLDEEQRRYAEIVRSSGEALLSIINDILDFSKIEAGKLELEKLDFKILSMLDDFAATLAVRAHEKGLELLCAADPDVPALLQGDPGRLRQILTNLVGNAIKFTSQGEVAVRVSCLSETNGCVELGFSIRDTGIGIPPDKLGLLFNKFSQVDASTTRRFGGTGLGLAISKQLAELMGGQISVESEVGVGSEFRFSVRMTLQPEDTPDQRSANAGLANLRGVRILVVDDNATSREMLNVRLTSWGMRPAEAVGGADALEALAAAYEQRDPFQIAILDMQMPAMDGAMLGQAIKCDAQLSATVLVLLSSLAERGDARRFEKIGFAGYLVKPLRHTDLFNVLTSAFNHSAKHPIVTRHSAKEILRKSLKTGSRLLLVEDNIINQQVALGIFKNFGLRAEAVANGAEAVHALENIHYDLVLMDIQMPVMDGLEATRYIRNIQSKVLNHHIPIIAMTANAMQGDRELCLETGMNDYVSKPVDPTALAEVINRWLPDTTRPGEVKKDRSAGQVNAVQQEPAAIEDHAPLQAEAISERVFDESAFMRRLMGDEELAKVVMAGFLEDIPLQIRALMDSIKAGNIYQAERHAHTIKGAAANIGAEALRAVAFDMERSGKTGNLVMIQAGMEGLERQFECLKEVLKKKI